MTAQAPLPPDLAEEHAQLRERFEMLSSASFEGILIHEDGVVIHANQRLAELTGYDIPELLGPETFRRCLAPEDYEFVRGRIREGKEGIYVVTAVRKDGSRFRAEFLSKQGKLGDRPVRVAAVRDVDDRERTQALVRESEERLRDLAAAAFDFFVISRDGLLIEVGGRLEETLGYPREAVLGRNMLDFVAPEVLEATREIAMGREVFAYDSVLVHANGERVPVEVQAVLSTHEGYPVRVAGVRDLRPARRLEAERRKLELRAERGQRLESLGVLAGGIAHEFNNLLVGILGNADLLLTGAPAHAVRESAAAIREAGERAAALTREMLLAAGRRDSEQRDAVDAGELVRELRDRLGTALPRNVDVETTIEPGCIVLGHRPTLTQMLSNLLTNASDALAGQAGKVSVHVAHVTAPDARWHDAMGAPVGPGRWVMVELKDTGRGMDEATRARVFVPFFTTKDSGRGLGLAACLGIASSHGGAILVESEVGQGTSVSVLLPEYSEKPVVAPDEPSARSHPCRVLVVDDERLVRVHLRRVLEQRGYMVDEADGGTSGLAKLAQSPTDVVVLDFTMGDMNGVEVIRRIRESGSRVPIILSSGYLDAATERDLDPGSFQAFLPKPYRVSELLAAIELARSSVPA